MLSQTEARRIRGLQTRKNREREGLFVAEGIRVVEDLVDSGLVLHEVVVAPSVEDTPRGQALLRRAEQRAGQRPGERSRKSTRVLRATDVAVRDLSGTDAPQGILAVARIPQHTLNDIAFHADSVDRAAGDVVLVLDGVQDPGNLGTLIRAADAFAIAGVVALPGTVDCWNPKVVRAAAGSLFRLPVVYAATHDVAAWLSAHDVRAYAADAGGRDIEAIEPAARAALVVGNEGAGLSDEVRAFAKETVAIAMPGRAESLNVAVAAGILLYLFTRQRS